MLAFEQGQRLVLFHARQAAPELAVNYEIAQLIIDYRELDKLKATYADALPKLIDEDGRIPRLNRILFTDSVATMFGAMAGTSPVTSYVESAAGVQAGGRTGLTALTVAVLFLACLFIAPLAGVVPAYATAPALLFVACLMLRDLGDIEWNDTTEAVPAAITALVIPFTYSIAEGIAFGFITYALLKLTTGRAREVKPVIWVIAALFAFKIVYIGT